MGYQNVRLQLGYDDVGSIQGDINVMVNGGWGGVGWGQIGWVGACGERAGEWVIKIGSVPGRHSHTGPL